MESSYLRSGVRVHFVDSEVSFNINTVYVAPTKQQHQGAAAESAEQQQQPEETLRILYNEREVFLKAALELLSYTHISSARQKNRHSQRLPLLHGARVALEEDFFRKVDSNFEVIRVGVLQKARRAVGNTFKAMSFSSSNGSIQWNSKYVEIRHGVFIYYDDEDSSSSSSSHPSQQVKRHSGTSASSSGSLQQQHHFQHPPPHHQQRTVASIAGAYHPDMQLLEDHKHIVSRDGIVGVRQELLTDIVAAAALRLGDRSMSADAGSRASESNDSSTASTPRWGKKIFTKRGSRSDSTAAGIAEANSHTHFGGDQGSAAKVSFSFDKGTIQSGSSTARKGVKKRVIILQKGTTFCQRISLKHSALASIAVTSGSECGTPTNGRDGYYSDSSQLNQLGAVDSPAHHDGRANSKDNPRTPRATASLLKSSIRSKGGGTPRAKIAEDSHLPVEFDDILLGKAADECAFELSVADGPRRTFLASSPEECIAWVRAINIAMLEKDDAPVINLLRSNRELAAEHIEFPSASTRFRCSMDGAAAPYAVDIGRFLTLQRRFASMNSEVAFKTMIMDLAASKVRLTVPVTFVKSKYANSSTAFVNQDSPTHTIALQDATPSLNSNVPIDSYALLHSQMWKDLQRDDICINGEYASDFDFDNSSDGGGAQAIIGLLLRHLLNASEKASLWSRQGDGGSGQISPQSANVDAIAATPLDTSPCSFHQNKTRESIASETDGLFLDLRDSDRGTSSACGTAGSSTLADEVSSSPVAFSEAELLYCAKEILSRCNRTQSGGDTYFSIDSLLCCNRNNLNASFKTGVGGHVVSGRSIQIMDEQLCILTPLSVQADALQINVDAVKVNYNKCNKWTATDRSKISRHGTKSAMGGGGAVARSLLSRSNSVDDADHTLLHMAATAQRAAETAAAHIRHFSGNAPQVGIGPTSAPSAISGTLSEDSHRSKSRLKLESQHISNVQSLRGKAVHGLRIQPNSAQSVAEPSPRKGNGLSHSKKSPYGGGAIRARPSPRVTPGKGRRSYCRQNSANDASGDRSFFRDDDDLVSTPANAKGGRQRTQSHGSTSSQGSGNSKNSPHKGTSRVSSVRARVTPPKDDSDIADTKLCASAATVASVGRGDRKPQLDLAMELTNFTSNHVATSGHGSDVAHKSPDSARGYSAMSSPDLEPEYSNATTPLASSPNGSDDLPMNRLVRRSRNKSSLRVAGDTFTTSVSESGGSRPDSGVYTEPTNTLSNELTKLLETQSGALEFNEARNTEQCDGSSATTENLHAEGIYDNDAVRRKNSGKSSVFFNDVPINGAVSDSRRDDCKDDIEEQDYFPPMDETGTPSITPAKGLGSAAPAKDDNTIISDVTFDSYSYATRTSAAASSAASTSVGLSDSSSQPPVEPFTPVGGGARLEEREGKSTGKSKTKLMKMLKSRLTPRRSGGSGALASLSIDIGHHNSGTSAAKNLRYRFSKNSSTAEDLPQSGVRDLNESSVPLPKSANKVSFFSPMTRKGHSATARSKSKYETYQQLQTVISDVDPAGIPAPSVGSSSCSSSSSRNLARFKAASLPSGMQLSASFDSRDSTCDGNEPALFRESEPIFPSSQLPVEGNEIDGGGDLQHRDAGAEVQEGSTWCLRLHAHGLSRYRCCTTDPQGDEDEDNWAIVEGTFQQTFYLFPSDCRINEESASTATSSGTASRQRSRTDTDMLDSRYQQQVPVDAGDGRTLHCKLAMSERLVTIQIGSYGGAK